MSSMYSLTRMTGREASAQRTVVIGTVELNWQVWIILLVAFLPAVLLTAVLWPFLGQLAIVTIPVIEGVAVFLIHRRSSKGLRLRTYRAMWDRKKASLDTFMLCGQKIETLPSDLRILSTNTVAYSAGPHANEEHSYVELLAAQHREPAPPTPKVSPSRATTDHPEFEQLDAGLIGREDEPTSSNTDDDLNAARFLRSAHTSSQGGTYD